MSFPTDLSFRGESEVWNFWQPKYVAVGTGPGGEENMKIAQIPTQPEPPFPGGQALRDRKPLYVGFSDMPLVSISNAQRKPIPNANFVGTVYHGLPSQFLKPTYRPNGDYLAFLGRISPEKRPDRAIRIARALEIPLKIAAKVDKVDDV